MTISDIRSYLSALEENSALGDEKNFDMRSEVIEFLEFEIVSAMDGLVRQKDQPELMLLQAKTAELMARIENVNINLFEKLRALIRAGQYRRKEFDDLVNVYVDRHPDPSTMQEPRYDNVDVFVDGLLGFSKMPEETKELEPQMVYYQKTPARMVFELVRKTQFNDRDIFYDLGSGLGQVPMLVNLMTGNPAKGVEFDPGFCNYARQRVADLQLRDVDFVNADARKVDYSDGTVFFMFTPFTGGILQSVLDLLKKESLKRTVRIITLGPCTAAVAMQSWLHSAEPENQNVYKIAFFESV